MDTNTSTAPIQPGEAKPIGAPGVRPSKRERDKMKVNPATVKPEAALENERQAIAGQLVEQEIIKDPPKQDEAGQQQPGQEGAGGESGEPQAFTLKDLAAKLEMPTGELYKLQVPTGNGNGETISLGEMKDFYRQNVHNIDRLANVDREEVTLRTEKGRALRDLDQLVNLLPPEAVSPQYIQAVRQQAQTIAQGEIQRLIQVEPAFSDPVKFQAARMAMGEAATAYGLTPGDVDNIIDHRWILALHDLAQLRAARAGAQALKPIPTGDSRPSGKGVSQSVSQQQALAKKAKSGDKAAQAQAALGILVNSTKRKG